MLYFKKFINKLSNLIKLKNKGGEYTMGRYLILWKHEMSRIPEDPKEQIELFTKLIDS